METQYINYDEFEPERLVFGLPETRYYIVCDGLSKSSSQLAYQQISISYRYKIVDLNGDVKEFVAPLRIESPDIYSPYGIKTEERNGYDESTIFSRYNMKDLEVSKFCSMGEEHTGHPPGFWKLLYNTCLDEVWNARSRIPVAQMDKKEWVSNLLEYPLFYIRDPMTFRIHKKCNLTKYFKVMCSGNPLTTHIKASFYLPIVTSEIGDQKKYQEIPWELLRNVEIVYRPIIKFPRIHIASGRIKIKFEIESAIVKDIRPINTGIIQQKSLDRLSSDEIYVKAMKEKFDYLVKCKKEQEHIKEKEEKEDMIPCIPII